MDAVYKQHVPAIDAREFAPSFIAWHILHLNVRPSTHI